MKNEHDQAQVLLDAMEDVDASMLQQAYATDTPEKFRALGRVKATKTKKERPDTALRRWVSVAACLAVALLLAFSPWFFSSLMPPQPKPPATQATQTNPTATQVPTAPQLNMNIELNREMNIWFHGDIHLQCAYVANADVCEDGKTITVTLQITNAGAAIQYTGTLEDQFGTALLRSDTNPEYAIESNVQPSTSNASSGELAHLAEVSIVYQFIVPEDAPEDHYTLETTLFGNKIVFNTKATLRPKYVPCLADLPEEAQKIIARDSYGSESQYYSYTHASKYIPVYGEFGDTYVAFWNTWGDAVMTYETVNGLQFVYGSTATIDVFTPTGIYTLTEAFESGLLTAEQVKQVHENWLYVGSSIRDRLYEPQIRMASSTKLTHWGENRWAYSRSSYSGNAFFAGEIVRIQVDIVNYGPETTYDSITNIIGSTAYLISDQTGFTLESTGMQIYGRGPDGIWSTGAIINVTYIFRIPEDFDEGIYTFVFTVDDEEIRFDKESAAEERNMTILQFIGAYEKSLFFGKDYRDDPELKKNGHMPVYGQFVGHRNGYWYSASVFIYPTDTTDGQPSIQIINGLEFEIPDGYQLHVISETYGAFTLAEAFDEGIITEEMLQEVYDNYIFLQNSSTTIKP
jgi:hypothetical protein